MSVIIFFSTGDIQNAVYGGDLVNETPLTKNRSGKFGALLTIGG